MNDGQEKMEKIVSLCKRRGFIFPGSEIYGGLAGTWDYGPLGVLLKQNITRMWWNRFVEERDDIVGIDSAIVMNPGVWEASGHVGEFTDPMIDCKKCKARFRADHIDTSVGCPTCGAHDFTEVRPFNMMFRTFTGSVEDSANKTYLRPETAQGMFINFKNVLDTMRRTVPFGIAQVGKAFRNEITPRDFLFRAREFEQMEIEYFIKESDWEKYFDEWREEVRRWIKDIGIVTNHMHEAEILEGERAHYSKRTIDFEYQFPFGRKELYGLAYRGDFDLKNHFKEPPYREEGGVAFFPHVIEPTWGVDRTVLALLLSAYHEEDERIVLKLVPSLAPYTIAVFPLVRNKPELSEKALNLYRGLKKNFMVTWDDRGNIGKRYYSQDEIGTPWCVTIDYQTLEDSTVTVRDRDTMKQERVGAPGLQKYFEEKLQG